MTREPLDTVPLWLLFVAVCAVTALALDGGYRLGLSRSKRAEGEKETPVGAMVGAILALLAFMLAFTFGMAATRFEDRRQAVLDEANAVGTTYLRAQLLRDERTRANSARLLREYVDVRMRGVQEDKVAEALARSEELHVQLWEEARKAAASDPTPITSLYIQSLNEVIDQHASRVQIGVRSRIPSTIWLVLSVLAMLSMASVGYQAGVAGTRRTPAMLWLVLGFSVVMYLIADLDRPGEGFLVVSQQAIADVRSSMNATNP